MDAQTNASIVSYHDITHSNVLGGTFIGDVKRIGHNILQGIRQHGPGAIRFLTQDILPIAREVIKLIKGGEGGIVIGGDGGEGGDGGRMISRSHLRNRAHRM